MELMQASRQWATRPMDERFTSIPEMRAHCQHIKETSRARVVSSRTLSVVPVEGTNHEGLRIVGPSGHHADITHWAFGQLAQRAGAPAGYLRDLPAELAADNLNYGLKVARNVEDIGVLIQANGGPAPEVRAVTGPTYGRIWNADVLAALENRFGDGVTGQFRVPGEWGKAVTVTKENTTLYASDRDMFVFLADETNRISLPNRRDGKTGTLARGFFIENSEVGAGTMDVSLFLFDFVCGNRIVWGAQDFKRIKIRHTAGAPDRWMREVAPIIARYSQSSAGPTETVLLAAQQRRVDDLDAFLNARFTRPQVAGIKVAHMEDEGRPMETVWDVVTGVTAFARNAKHQDARVDLERAAGKVLQLAA